MSDLKRRKVTDLVNSGDGKASGPESFGARSSFLVFLLFGDSFGNHANGRVEGRVR